MRALPISRTARRRFGLDAVAPEIVPAAAPAKTPTEPAAPARPAPGGRPAGLAVDIVAARKVTAAVNATRRAGEPSAQAGELAAFELLHEISHLLIDKAAELVPASAMPVSTDAVEDVVGEPLLDDLLDAVAVEFPDVGDRPAPSRLEELLLLRLANENPAARPLRALIDDDPIPSEPRTETMTALEAYQAGLTPIGPNGETLIEMLRAPARAYPTSLAGQLRYVREHWRGLLGAELDVLLDRLLVTLDVIAEEERGLHLRFGGGGDGGAGGGGRGEAPDLSGLDVEPERFSSDSAWMPRLVLIAKSTHVWLDQLSRRYERDIHTLDAIPDEELDRLARWGITGLWLIGLWERSRASRRIKAWRGNPDAAASAYSLDDYRIADDLGGEAAWADLRGRAWARGVRLASDMVPNHMGIDSRWVIEHPEWFLSLPEPPYPGYTFNGENVAEDERVEIRLEDHYWDNSDAAVVFERRTAGRATGGTSTTATTARASPGTTPPSSTSSRPPSASRSSRRSSTSRGGSPSSASTRRWCWRRSTSGACGSRRPARAAARSRRGPSSGRCPRPTSTPPCPPSSGATSSTGSPPRSPTRCCSPRRSGCSRATSSGRSACTASTTPRSCTCSATRTTRATGGCSRRPSSSTPRSSSATSTS